MLKNFKIRYCCYFSTHTYVFNNNKNVLIQMAQIHNTKYITYEQKKREKIIEILNFPKRTYTDVLIRNFQDIIQ